MKRRRTREDSSDSKRNTKYRKDLSKLKDIAISMIEEMMAFDLKYQEDQQNAFEIAQGLRDEIQKLCKKHFEEENLHKRELRIKHLELEVEKVKDCKKTGVVGGDCTLLAVKNNFSYLIATSKKGLTLVEEAAQIYSGMHPVAYGSLRDIAYIPPLDCYLMAHEDKLYRKDIDDKTAYLFMDIKCGWRPGCCFRSSNTDQRLVTVKDMSKISVIDLEARKIEMEMEKKLGNEIMDFKLFGEEQRRIVSVTKDGYVILYNLGSGRRRGGVTDCKEIEQMEEREEGGNSVAVCERNEYVLVEVRKSVHPFLCSRMLVFKLNRDSLVMTAGIDLFSQKIGFKCALESCGYGDGRALWVGLTRDDKGPIQLYGFDTRSGELDELVDKRVSHQEKYPRNLHYLKGKFYYTGSKGKVMSLRLIHE